MNKYLLCLLVCLSGCIETQPIKEFEKPFSSEGRKSFGYTSGISWQCQELEVNDKLIWIGCQASDNICLQVSYRQRPILQYALEMDNEEVVHSRNVCISSSNSEYYVAFIKEQRKYLTTRCGENLLECEMVSRVIVR